MADPYRTALTPRITGSFFALASIITLTAAATLAFPSSPLAVIWTIKPDAYRQLLALQPWPSLGFAVLCVAMIFASVGTFRRTRWGWRLALAIFAVNGLSDAARMVSGDWVEGAVGVVAAGTILWWLTRPQVRDLFGNR